MIHKYAALDQINREKLRDLIEIGFGRRLSANYFETLGPSTIIVDEEEGAYIGAAIIVDSGKGFSYVDKFVVDRKFMHTGRGKKVWEAVTGLDAPLCWRSRENNLINFWYLRHADGHVKKGDWFVFWRGLDPSALPDAISYTLEKPETLQPPKGHQLEWTQLENIYALKRGLPYVENFSGQYFVIKIGGEVIDNPQILDAFSDDISILQHLGIKSVLVHGGGAQADELSRSLGYQIQKIEGERVTDEDALRVAKMIFGGEVNIAVLSALRRHGAKAIEVSGVDAGIIKAKRRGKQPVNVNGQIEEIDYGHVGEILSIEAEPLFDLTRNGYIPVISPLGGDDEGNVFNINADIVAEQVASRIKAKKLVYLTNVRGILSDPNDESKLISYLSPERAESLINEGVIKGGMIPKVKSCIAAVSKGVERAHIIDGMIEDSLLIELFTSEGIGTMILSPEKLREYELQELSPGKGYVEKENEPL